MKKQLLISRLFTIFVLLYMFVFLNEGSAQSPISTSNNLYFVNLGLGLGSPGVAGIGNFTFQFGENLLALRTAISSKTGGDEFWDVGILYGRTTKPAILTASIAAGIGMVGGSHDTGLFSRDEKIEKKIGFPVEAQLSWRLTKVFGFALNGFANVNSEKTFGGATICLQVGKLR